MRILLVVALLFGPVAEVHARKLPSIEHRIDREVKNNWRRKVLRREAKSVIWCESRNDPHARNGQYFGLAQMGEYERESTGWGWLIRKQIRAMRRWWDLTGGDWESWAEVCQP